jgi:hypothetical protein
MTQVERQLCIVNRGYAIVTKQQSGDRMNKFRLTPAVNLQDYVSVTPDTSPYKNRPHGYGYITIVLGVGAATSVSVKYSAAHNDG